MMFGGFLLRVLVRTLALVLLCSTMAAQAAESFRVRDIRVEGLQRLPVERVFRNLVIDEGDTVTSAQLADAVKRLYASGDFEDVQVGRDGDVLVVVVSERPMIARIELDGNKSIDEEQLRKGLKQSGLTEGEVFRRSTLEGIASELQRQYVSQGRYGASVNSEVVPLPRNRVERSEERRVGKECRFRGLLYSKKESDIKMDISHRVS